MSELPWQKLLVAGGVAVGGTALLCYLLDDKPATDKKARGAKPSRPDDGEVSKEKVAQILQEIYESQQKMKVYLKSLTKELQAGNLSFAETYDKVAQAQPSDPLENNKLSMAEFDKLLDKYHNEPAVREGIQNVMDAPNSANVSPKVQQMSVKKILEVHQFMLKELGDFVDKKFPSAPKGRNWDMKTVTIVAQAMVGAEMEKKFNITSEDIEGAVLMHHQVLASNQEFAQIQGNIQAVMQKLISAA